jgi:G3E family GTPase
MEGILEAPVPIPIDILTGFLGAGKTTLLNALVKDKELANSVVLINEFGEVALDHLLVEGVEGDMIVLASGCLCCTIRGELVSALEDLLRRRDNNRIRPFDRVVIETTGLADPAPILNTLMLHPYISRRFAIDAVIAVIDVMNGAATLDAHGEARRQAAVADRLVVAKTDLAQARDVAALRQRLARLNPTAPILDAAAGEAAAAALFGAGLYDPSGKTADVGRWLKAEALESGLIGDEMGHARSPGLRTFTGSDAGIADGPRAAAVPPTEHARATGALRHSAEADHAHEHDRNRHDERIRAFCLASASPLHAASLDLFLALLRSLPANRLLRMKGIVGLAERPDEPLILHGAQHVMHEPVRLAQWPDADRRTRIVLIVEDLSEAEIRRLWAAVREAPAFDQPDRQALVENPLSIKPGGLLGSG